MQKLVAEVLAAWREAERVASEHDPGTHDHEAAIVAMARLKALYAELTAPEATDASRHRMTLDAIRLPDGA